MTFLLLAAISLMVEWHTLLSLFSLAWNNEAYTHILLILPITLSLVSLHWSEIRTAPQADGRSGSVLMVVAVTILAFAGWATSDLQLSLDVLAVVFWWIGSFLCCFGTRISHALMFPLGFLFWLVPFPAFLLNGIVAFLQQGSAYAARALFTIFGVPVAQDGILLTIPGLTVEVAQECSSIRSSMILLITTMVLAQLFLRSPWRKTLVVLLVIPLSLAKNGLRIFAIAMLGTRVDPGYLTGRFHHQGGVIFLVVALAVIFLLFWLLREDKPGAKYLQAH